MTCLVASSLALASPSAGQSIVPDIQFQQAAGDAADPFDTESTTAAEFTEPTPEAYAPVADQSTLPDIQFQQAASDAADPFESDTIIDDSMDDAAVIRAEYSPQLRDRRPRLAKFQTPFADDPGRTKANQKMPKPPCWAVPQKSWNQFGIGVELPAGELPADQAQDCWDQINQSGQFSDVRCWPQFCYAWDATCLCHRPLYFEEVNLERYGYGCGYYDCNCVEGHCLQTACSAAHFFATIPALPYCLAAECPGECQYTLGHYRPGSCPPWRNHYPPWDPIAALSAGGLWTGMVFLIP
jgi:hypothetical protein